MQRDLEQLSKRKTLQLYYPKAFNRDKRYSVDISKKLLASDNQLSYNSRTRMITIRQPRNSLPLQSKFVQPPVATLPNSQQSLHQHKSQNRDENKNDMVPDAGNMTSMNASDAKKKQANMQTNMRKLPIGLQAQLELKYKDMPPEKLKEL